MLGVGGRFGRILLANNAMLDSYTGNLDLL